MIPSQKFGSYKEKFKGTEVSFKEMLYMKDTSFLF